MPLSSVIVDMDVDGPAPWCAVLKSASAPKKTSNKKLNSQISYFNRISRDLITKSNKNSLLRDKKSRLS